MLGCFFFSLCHEASTSEASAGCFFFFSCFVLFCFICVMRPARAKRVFFFFFFSVRAKRVLVFFSFFF